jgi:hypothetical protein
MRTGSRRLRGTIATGALALMLAGCGAGGGGAINSTPAPSPTPSPTPAPTPAPTPPPIPTPTPTNYDTPEYRRSTGPSQHQALAAYEAGASGAGITVGIIDSGLSNAGGEFTGRISSASADFAGNGSYADGDDDGHGTAVATVLAGGRNDRFVLGMAWGATVLALRADTPGSCASADDCSFTTTAITAALDHARVNGARVVNISLGGDDGATPALRAAIGRATAAGIIIVIATGNESGAAPDAFAQSFADPSISNGLVILAGSVDTSNNHSSFANGAAGFETTTLSAVGEDVLTQDRTGTQFLYSGTSFSAPQIAGAAALLAQAFPNLGSAQIVDLLLRTATDAGATGADPVYGRGVLNVAAAFQPQGATSLAASRVPVTLGATSTLSTAMGDATGQSVSTIVTDSYGRAYRADLAAGTRGARPSLALTPGLAGGVRSTAGAVGGSGFALAIRPGRGSRLAVERRMQRGQDEARARLLSGLVTSRLAGGGQIALGYARTVDGLGRATRGGGSGAFLIAGEGGSANAGEARPRFSALMRHPVGAGVHLSLGTESGTMRDPDRRRLVTGTAPGRYDLVTVAADRRFGPLATTFGLTLMREDRSTLGARLAPVFGGQSARTFFADADLRLDAGHGWQVSAHWRQGWTKAAAGGALEDGAMLRSTAWSLDIARAALIGRDDRLAIRVAQPLRVSRGLLRLTVPQSYDYATRTATLGTAMLDLAPAGRQLDSEMSYGRPLLGGWADLNLYRRQDSGNIAGYPVDVGGALRFSIGF